MKCYICETESSSEIEDSLHVRQKWMDGWYKFGGVTLCIKCFDSFFKWAIDKYKDEWGEI